MNSNYHTLNSIIARALEHHVDFEVWYGLTTAKQPSVRAHLLISPPNAPAVLVNCGDELHNWRLSKIVLAKYESVEVKIDDLLKVIDGNSVIKPWKRSLEADPFEYTLDALPSGIVNLSGELTSSTSVSSTSKLDAEYYSYNLTSRAYGMTQASGEVIELPSSQYVLEVPAVDPEPWVTEDLFLERHSFETSGATYQPREMDKLELGKNAIVSGAYRYPGIIQVASLIV